MVIHIKNIQKEIVIAPIKIDTRKSEREAFDKYTVQASINGPEREGESRV
jgi:hypothetical protein